MVDLLSGVSYALRREIPKKEKIEGNDIIALRDFVVLLLKVCICLKREFNDLQQVTTDKTYLLSLIN